MSTKLQTESTRPSKHAVVDGSFGCLLFGLIAAHAVAFVLFSLTFLLVNAGGG